MQSELKCKFKAYRITCIPSGKVYIGITSGPLRRRWNSHISCAFRKRDQTKLYRSMRKYGAESFSIEHIASSTSYENLLAAEVLLIAQYDSKSNGLNSTTGGDGVIGLRFREESKRRMSEVRRELWKSDEYRRKISESQKSAWKRKSEEEIERHKARARATKVYNNRRPRQKIQRQIKGKGWNMRIKTHCPHGHEYTQENTYRNPNKPNARACLTCKRANRNNARKRRAEQRRALNSEATKNDPRKQQNQLTFIG